MYSLSEIIYNIDRSTYKLDMSGVVGLFGGGSAVDALETVHLYAHRRWAGWYNYPGSVTVAKRFGQMADSRLWDSVFPGPNESPAITFRLAGKSGPDYSGSFSGTKLRTGYLGYLIAAESTGLPEKSLQLSMKDGTPGRKTGSSASVTVISLPSRHQPTRKLTDDNVTKQKDALIPINPKKGLRLALWAIVPSLVSIMACVFCFIGRDSFCASLILLGIVSSGISSLVLGTAILHIRAPIPSTASPPGDGLMFPEDGSIIVLKGGEADVNIITKGEFVLDYSAGILPHPKHHAIGISSLLLMAQFLAQLLLIPFSSFFGQIMFLISFVASGVYHLCVVSNGREKVHREILLRELSAQMQKWTLGTRTQMAVFVCLLLGDGSDPDATLSSIIPNETPVWRYWKKKVLEELEHFWETEPSLPYAPNIQAGPEDKADTDGYSHFTEKDVMLLEDLIGDAWCVFNRYSNWQDGESCTGPEQGDGSEESSNACLLPAGGSPV